MKLSDYPRPPADNGRGIHWSPSQYQWGKKDWRIWQQRVLEMGLKWIKVNVPPDYNAQAIVKRLVDIEVMPVCRFIRKNPTRIEGAIEKSIEDLVKLGARYFETNNEPDADIEWVNYHRPNGWEEVVVKNLIYDANRLYDLGGIPAFVAFNSGPTEPRNPIQILVAQDGGRDLFEKGLWVSLHNYGKGRPFNYPNDRVRMFGDPVSEADWLQQKQPDFWSEAEVIEYCWHGASRDEVNRARQAQKNPNITIMTDITCFRAYEYWNQLISQEGLPSIPIMMTEGGWETGDRVDNFYPEPTAQQASDLNFMMFQFMQGDIEMTINKPNESTERNPVPDYLFSVMPWHMGEKAFGADTSGQWEQGAWFSDWHNQKFGLQGELPLIQMVRDLPSKVRADGPVPPEWAKRKGLTPTLTDELTFKAAVGQSEAEHLFNQWDKWDYRFTYLKDGIQLKQVETDGPRWKVIQGLWQDKGETNTQQAMPPGYIMVKVLDELGNPLPDVTFEVSRNDAVDKAQTKGNLDQYLGNYKMSATLGTYRLKINQDGLSSDEVMNLGLGGEEPGSDFDETSFFFLFQRVGTSTETSQPTEVSEVTTTAEGDPTGPTAKVAATSTTTSDIQASHDAASFGVTITQTDSSPRCAVSKVHHYDASEKMGASTLYVDVLTTAGKRAFGSVVLVKDVNGQQLRVVVEKPETEPGGNMPMWSGNTYTIEGVEVNGEAIATDVVTGLQSTIPNQGEGHAFLVVLQLL